MSKLFGFLAAALVGFSVSQARADLVINIDQLQHASMIEAQLTSGLKWKVGDKAAYSITLGGFINGTSNQFVREDGADGLWVEQDMDLGMMGKQKIEELFDKNTGAVKKVLANGQEQTLPAASDYDVVEMKQAHITVKAGDFDCIYAKIKAKKDGTIQEAWINPKQVPMSGMLKALADSQFGKVTQELTSFEFAK